MSTVNPDSDGGTVRSAVAILCTLALVGTVVGASPAAVGWKAGQALGGDGATAAGVAGGTLAGEKAGGALGAAAATFLNIGPAFGDAGPYGDYAFFPRTTRIAFIVLMWVGRIEIIPVLVLLTPAYWRS